MTAGVGPAVAAVRARTWWDGFRWALFVAWVVIVVVGLSTMTRSSTLDALRSDLDGGVDRVTVAGSAASGSGDAVQEVRWRSGGVNHRVLVAVAAPNASTDDFSDDFSDDGLERVEGRDVGAVLVAQHPGLKVSRADLDEEQARDEAAGGLRLGLRIESPFDGAAGWAAGIHLLLSVILIVFGPQPWRATRWGWFWVLGVPYVGLPLMLLLSGPTRWIPPPRTSGRLTGGKAFLLAVVTYSLASVIGLDV